VSSHDDPPTTPFAQPFVWSDLTWCIQTLQEGGEEALVVPCVSLAALRGRLDAALTPHGWGLQFQISSGDAVACHLTLQGVTKGVVVSLPAVGGSEAAARLALDAAARLFGAHSTLPEAWTALLPFDPETQTVLHEPEPPEGVPLLGPATLEAPKSGAIAADRAGEGGAAAATDPASTDAPGRPEPQQMIDRLVDRLKEEGKGLAAARILVKHGGYGQDVETARQLYRELRGLLLAGSNEA